jgi:hypothetical protein
MEHVVFFPAHDGSPAFRRVGTLEDAVRLVEHLRNVEGVAEVSCHALTEVPLAFRAYYRVEVPTAEPVPAVVAPEVPAQAEAPEVPALADAAPPTPELAPDHQEPEHQESEPVLASANGHSVDGAKSLGFFA